jgi:O-antigen/teichoic acid export membrane protein
VSSPSPARRVGGALPEGTLSVAIGLVLSGVCSYAFLALTRRSLSNEGNLAIQQLWIATFTLAPGFFLPLEQEVARAVSHRRALGQGGRPVIARAALIGGSVAMLVLIALAAASSVLKRRMFEGNGALVFALMLAVVSWGAAHLGRGVLSGNNRFGSYGLLLGGDGVIRLLLCAVFFVVGVDSAGLFGLLVAVPPMIALAVSFYRERDVLTPGPEAPWSEVTRNLGWLLLGSLGSAFLVNAGPLVAKALANADETVKSATFSVGDNPDEWISKVAAFTFGLLVARVPLFLFQAVQAALLPKLAHLAATGAVAEFRSGFRKLLFVVATIAAIGAGAAYVAGPFVVRLAFHARLPSVDLALLAIGAGAYMGAVAIAQALIALKGHAVVAAGWFVGVFALLAALLIQAELIMRVELALLIGSSAALLFFAFALRWKLRTGASMDADSLTEALHDLP